MSLIGGHLGFRHLRDTRYVIINLKMKTGVWIICILDNSKIAEHLKGSFLIFKFDTSDP